ncbi:genetic competence negative regulator [Sutcliffiella cohnii]|uniref:Adapter protein MecA n=1 Tax=Sutcliffiella cohnii TaxID=33932 RepID=A0A223KSE7_9BACI|nr:MULTISPECIES: genetic competence negative regulator [Sutcliffiella]AST92278.1 adaptor protein [Sutcliffiella cohnii]MED4017263.1 genetic competence negative regulator [Sutcliffiella cohnii]WBL13509.1 genetic competence negative regulator [Sutcliffiella sp. NC1]
MRLERINQNKIKIFLTLDDLTDRGLTKEDMRHDTHKVHQLFRDMIDEASEELGFHVSGSLAVEVYSLQAQGMVIIVTANEEMEDEEFNDDYIEMQVTVDETIEILYEFQTVEDIIQLAKRIYPLKIVDGAFYNYNNLYYLLLNQEHVSHVDMDTVIAVLSEYGEPSMITIHRIQEYGKEIMGSNALSQLNKYFHT